jgi:hypothetical protein
MALDAETQLATGTAVHSTLPQGTSIALRVWAWFRVGCFNSSAIVRYKLQEPGLSRTNRDMLSNCEYMLSSVVTQLCHSAPTENAVFQTFSSWAPNPKYLFEPKSLKLISVCPILLRMRLHGSVVIGGGDLRAWYHWHLKCDAVWNGYICRTLEFSDQISVTMSRAPLLLLTWRLSQQVLRSFGDLQTSHGLQALASPE